MTRSGRCLMTTPLCRAASSIYVVVYGSLGSQDAIYQELTPIQIFCVITQGVVRQFVRHVLNSTTNRPGFTTQIRC